MILQKATATFGKLKDSSLVFSDGLNILYAPNESGKSTWSHFLFCMFYGLSTKDRSLLADKNRYSPWSGDSFQGSLELIHQGVPLTIIRSTQRSGSPMGDFRCYYHGTSSAFPNLTASNFGEQTLGVTRSIYSRTAFLGQNSFSVSSDVDLEQKIISLISSGDETISYTKATDSLRSCANRHKYNHAGIIPSIELEISQIQHSLDTFESLTSQIEDASSHLKALEEQESYLILQQTALDNQKMKQQIMDYQKACKDEAAARSTLDQLTASTGILPNEKLLTSFEDELIALSSQRKILEESESVVRESINIASSAKESYDSFKKDNHVKKHILFGLVPSAILSLILFAFSYNQSLLWPSFCAVFLILLSFFYSYFLHRKHRINLHQLEKQVENALNVAKSKASAYTSLDQAYRKSLQNLEEHLRPYSSCVTAENLTDTIFYLRHQVSLIKDASLALEMASLSAKVMKAHLPPDYIDNSIVPTSDCPILSQDEITTSLLSVRASLQETHSKIDTLTGQLMVVGNKSDLLEQLRQKNHLLAKQQQEFEALTLARDTLSESHDELSNRFGPRLSQETSKIFRQIVGNQYDQVYFNRDFSLSAKESGSIVPHDAQLLSCGAYDQIYFSLRLALCHLLLPQEQCAPIILDDAFCNFDDNRLHNVLDYLLKESRSRQILLFTCQHREGDYLKGYSGVSYQEL